MTEADKERERALAILRRHGSFPFCFQTLAPGLRYHFEGDEAFVAYADNGRAWVVAGEPVAPRAEVAEVARRFVERARTERRRVRFFGVDGAFAEQASLGTTFIGEEPLWDPSSWPGVLSATRSLREQLRRARAKGVTVRVLGRDELREASALKAEIQKLARRWLASRRMAPMGFLLRLEPLGFIEERLFVVAEHEARAVEVLVASPIHAREGWLVEHVLRDPRAPNGTTELLIDCLMRSLAVAGSPLLSLGLAPLAGPVSLPLRLARRLGRFLYNFEGLYRFKAKLRPDRWEAVFVAYPPGEHGFMAMVDVLRCFARGRFFRFALASLRHLRRRLGRMVGGGRVG